MGIESVTQLCNLALSALGHGAGQVVDFTTDQGSLADECRLHYPLARRSTIRSHPWNFAITRADLSLSDDTPPFEFTYSYRLPDGCLKVLRSELEAAGTASVDAPYRIEGRRLLCNESVFAIEYVQDVEDCSQWDDLFVEALKYRLAAALAIPVTDSSKRSEAMMQMYQIMVEDAFVADAQEGTPREIVDLNPWVHARY